MTLDPNELTPANQLLWQDIRNYLALIAKLKQLPLSLERTEQIEAMGAAFQVLMGIAFGTADEYFEPIIAQYPWLRQFKAGGGFDFSALKKQAFLAAQAALASCQEAGVIPDARTSKIEKELQLWVYVQYVDNQMQGQHGSQLIYEVSTHEQQHVAFPIGGFSNYPKIRSQDTGETEWSGCGPFVVIEGGRFCAFRKFTYPMILVLKSDFDSAQLCLADGTVLDSLAQAGELFTQAYAAAKPEAGYATLVTPSAKLSLHQPEGTQFTLDELCDLLGCDALVLHELPAQQPFESLTLVRSATGLWPALKGPEAGFTSTQELNPVASAIWIRAYAEEKKDEDEKYYAANWLYGNVLLVNKAALLSKYRGRRSAY